MPSTHVQGESLHSHTHTALTAVKHLAQVSHLHARPNWRRTACPVQQGLPRLILAAAVGLAARLACPPIAGHEREPRWQGLAMLLGQHLQRRPHMQTAKAMHTAHKSASRPCIQMDASLRGTRHTIHLLAVAADTQPGLSKSTMLRLHCMSAQSSSCKHLLADAQFSRHSMPRQRYWQHKQCRLLRHGVAGDRPARRALHPPCHSTMSAQHTGPRPKPAATSRSQHRSYSLVSPAATWCSS